MRIRKLNLKRYGHFEDHELEFPDTGITIIYGPNETGKSTSLSAISDLLYGFKHSTPYDYKFESKMLRIGASLISRSGDSLSFSRRKGNKETLLDENDSTLPDSSLSPFLGQSVKEFFETAFGLSHERLREGGDGISRSGGDLGKILFESGSGINDLADIQKSLDDEADGIFGKNKKGSRVLYQAIDSYQNAASEFKSASVKQQDWLSCQRAVSEADDLLAGIRTTLCELKDRQAMLTRWQRVMPILREIDALREDASQYGEPSSLPVDARDKYATALSRKRHSEDYLVETQTHLSESRERLAEFVVNDKLLDAQETIEAAYQRIASVEEHIEALPVVENELHELDRQIGDQAGKLNLPVDGGQPDIPGPLSLIALSDLVTARQKLDTALSKAAEDEAMTVAQIGDRQRELVTLGDVSDSEIDSKIFHQLRATFAALGAGGQKKRDLTRVEKKINKLLIRLSRWNKTQRELLAMLLPSPAVIEQHRNGIELAHANLEKVKDKVETSQANLYAALQELEDFQERERFVSDEDLAGARGLRQDAWLLVRRALDDNLSPNAKELAMFNAGDQLGPVYETLTAKADDVADSRLDSVQQIVQHKRLQQDAASKQKAYDGFQKQLKQSVEAVDAGVAAWEVICQPFLLSPISPAEMLEDLVTIEAINEAASTQDELADEILLAENGMAKATAELAAVADRLGIVDARSSDTDALLAQVETALEQKKESFTKAEKIRARITEQESVQAKYQLEIEALNQKIKEWQSEWNGCCSEVKIKPELTLTQVVEVARVWEELSRKMENRERLQAQFRKNHLVIEQFIKSVKTLASALQPCAVINHAGHAVDLVRQLHSESVRMQQIATSHMDQEKHIAEMKKALDKHHAVILESNSDIKVLTDLARVESEELLPDAITRAENQRKLEAAIDSASRRLSEAGEGVREDALRESVDNVPLSEIAKELDDLSAEVDGKDREREEAVRSCEQTRSALHALKSKSGAHQHAQTMENALAQMNVQSRDYLRLQAASILLKHGIEKIRDKHKDPILIKAGENFNVLTGGSFAGLGSEFDTSDNLTIVGIRPTGNYVDVGNMSDGTRDQLYLSLRLAFVESYCATEEPLPFIGDDLFVHFDDERTTAGLNLLARLRDCQVILFTHHEHLMKLAKSVLGDHVTLLSLKANQSRYS